MKREPSRKILGTFSLSIKTDRDLPGSRNSRRKYGWYCMRLVTLYHAIILECSIFMNAFMTKFINLLINFNLQL
jgi:hypothetical protein